MHYGAAEMPRPAGFNASLVDRVHGQENRTRFKVQSEVAKGFAMNQPKGLDGLSAFGGGVRSALAGARNASQTALGSGRESRLCGTSHAVTRFP